MSKRTLQKIGYTFEISHGYAELMVCVAFVYYWSFCETGRNVVYINRDVYILEYYTYIYILIHEDLY